MSLDRIAVVGISASGKSTFARALAARTGLPLRHADQLEWLPNWRLRPDAELQSLHRAWLSEPRWIIEGWIDPQRATRLSVADLVIDLDFAGWFCALRVLARMARGGRRPEMPQGCVDRFSFSMMSVVFWKKERPSIDGALKAAPPKKYVRLNSRREAAAWLAGVERSQSSL